MIQKPFLKCYISNKLDGTQEKEQLQENSNETENEDSDEGAESKNEDQDEKMWDNGSIKYTVHWRTGNISFRNLRTWVIVRKNMKILRHCLISKN